MRHLFLLVCLLFVPVVHAATVPPPFESQERNSPATIKGSATTLGIESANTPGKDQIGDGPWVTRDGNMFMQMVLKDNDGFGNSMCFEYLRLNRRVGASRTMVFEYAISQSFSQNWLWFSVPQVTSDFGLAVGDTILWEWELQFSDGLFCIDSHRNFYYIRTRVGAPLPSIPDWRRVDIHDHGYISDDQIHSGMHYGLMASIGRSTGLDAIFVTDHSPDVTAADWNTIVAKCAEFTTSTFLMIPGLELTVDDDEQNQTPDGRLHLLALGLTRFLPAPEECCTDNWNLQLWTLRQALDSVAVQGAVAFAAHPTDGIFPNEGTLGTWSQANYDIGLVYPRTVFAGLEFFNERRITNNYGGVTDGFVYPYGWQLNPTWDSRWQNGMNRYLQLVKQYLNPLRVIALGGGSDAHQAAYETYAELLDDIGAYSNGLGSVHSMVYAPGALTKSALMNGLKQGAVIMTDGPAMAAWVDQDGNGSDDGTVGGSFTLTSGAQLHLTAQSINEFGNFTIGRLIRVRASGQDTVPVTVNGLTINTTVPLYTLADLNAWTAIVVELRTANGYRAVSSPVYITRQGSVDVELTLPSTAQLSPPRPNPVIQQALLTFSLPQADRVTLGIYDVNGRLVNLVVEGQLSAGQHSFTWQRGSAPTGLYFVRLATTGVRQTKKFALIQ